MYYELVGESRNTYKRHIFLNEMLSGQSKDYLYSIISHESERELDFDPRCFYLCLTGLPKSVYYDRYGVTANDMMLLYVTLEKEMVALWTSLGGRGEAILHLYGDKQIVFVFSFPREESGDQRALQVAQSACGRLQQLYLEHFLRDNVYANVTLLSRQLHRWEEIGPTLRRMQAAWRRCSFFHMKAQIWTSEEWDRSPGNLDSSLLHEALFRVRQAVQAGDAAGVKARTEELFLGAVRSCESFYSLNDALASLKEFERECAAAYALKCGDMDRIFDYTGYPSIERSTDALSAELSHLARQIYDKGVRYSPLIQKAMGLIQDHYASPDLSLTFLAERLDISSAYLSSVFKRETGIGLTQCIKTTRIRKAKALLTSTQLRVHQVAEQVGFQDKRYFCTIFKQEVGVTPHQYRSKIR